MKKVMIVGAGLAGSEAAWQAANLGAEVLLYEMRPGKMTPAHKTDAFAELVCSNSLRGAGMENAVGVLKEEMRRLGSGCHPGPRGRSTRRGSSGVQPLYHGKGDRPSEGEGSS